jgi:rubrerythrin
MAECKMDKNDIILNLKHGLDAEYRALDAYREFLPRIEDKTDRNLVEMIIADEKRHIKIVEQLINLVNESVK